MKIRVFLVCSGLGQVNRGFESFSQECFEVLSQAPTIDITLFKGGGTSSEKVITLPNLSRNTQLSLQLARLFNRTSYFIEQASFTLSLIPYICQEKPHVIYFSDGTVGNILWHWRNLTKQSYKLLFSNGAPFFPPLAPYCDYTQQLTLSHWQTAMEKGLPLEEQTFLPYGIKMPSKFITLSEEERKNLKYQLGLPQNQFLILSVGAINTSHKRMDYVIQEVASFPAPRPYLILLGEQESESQEVIQLGVQLLGDNGFEVKTVSSEQVKNYYQVADTFVLASLNEGFGRVFLEAMSYGLPCLAHNYEVSKFVLGDQGFFGDFSRSGSLKNLIDKIMFEGHNTTKYFKRYYHIYNQFSWDQLISKYVKMFETVSNFRPTV